jgi:phosphatidylglycerol lysyltransferase
MAGRVARVITALRREPSLTGGWRPLFGLVAALALCLLLLGRLGSLDGAAVLAGLGAVGPGQWLGAALLTLVSFLAVAGHDETLHRHLATGIRPAAARRAGFAAIALSQFLGLGVLTGALVRWRMLPAISLGLALRLTLATSVAFLAGWALLAAGLLALLGAGDGRWAAVLALAAAGAAAASVFAPRRGWPGLRVQARVLGLVALDCGAAALAFWVLAPAGVTLAQVLPALVLAIGAGLVSGAPGGLGAVELTLLALLPQVPDEARLASVLAWRLVYFVLPALVAVGVVLVGPRRADRRRHPRDGTAEGAEAEAGFAEAGLARQGQFAPLRAGFALWLAARLPNTLVALRQPLGTASVLPADCRSLANLARAEGRGVALYKVPPRVAAAARLARWQVVPVAREAWLDPAGFDLAGPARAGLRRKLRRAAEAGVLARAGQADPADLAAISAAWVRARGGEMGFSMGRFDPAYLAGQRLYVAWQGEWLVGFASFHCAPGEWALDLLRPDPAAPDGTAHALIAAAVADAGRAGLTRLSLAAVPEAAFPDARGPAATAGRRIARGATRRAGAGLYQFKSAFAPRWERLYLAAPRRPDLVLAAIEIRRAILRPPPLAAPAAGAGGTLLPEAAVLQDPALLPEAALRLAAREEPAVLDALANDENEIASPPPAWHRRAG